MGYRIVLADDHPLFRDALRLTLQDALGDVSFDEAGSLNEVVELLASADDVDLVLLDLKMPGVQGFSGLALVRAQFPLIPVVVVSGKDKGAQGRVLQVMPSSDRVLVEGVNRMMDQVEAAFREAGASVERIPGKDGRGDCVSVETSPGAGSNTGILVLSHLDTVHPKGTLEKNPFRIEGDRVYGPGTFDMKGGGL